MLQPGKLRLTLLPRSTVQAERIAIPASKMSVATGADRKDTSAFAVLVISPVIAAKAKVERIIVWDCTVLDHGH